MDVEKYERLDVDKDVALQIKYNYEQGFEILSNLSMSQVYLLACTTIRIIDGEIKRFEPCKWTFDPTYDAFETSCNTMFISLCGLEGWNYCPSCGREVKEGGVLF